MRVPARLHFGCFNCPRDGWINTDLTPHIRIARVPGLARLLHAAGKMTDAGLAEHRAGVFRRVRHLDVTRPWPFPDGAFEAVYSSHVLEHLPLRGARRCLSEAFHCFAPGGVLRIAVPDLDAHIRAFRQDAAYEWAVNFFEADEVSEKNMHHFMYNFDSLARLMRMAGFHQVGRREHGEGACPDAGALDNRPESLLVEAIRH